jgi:hypothetical protein
MYLKPLFYVNAAGYVFNPISCSTQKNFHDLAMLRDVNMGWMKVDCHPGIRLDDTFAKGVFKLQVLQKCSHKLTISQF